MVDGDSDEITNRGSREVGIAGRRSRLFLAAAACGHHQKAEHAAEEEARVANSAANGVAN